MENYVEFIRKKIFFKNVLSFYYIFIDIITSAISSTHIEFYFTCVQYVIH